MKRKEYRKPVLQRQGIARPIVILIIAVIAVAGLSLLLFFGSKQFAGKAIEFGTLNQNDAGFTLMQNTLDQGATVTFPVKVNIAAKSSVLSFELQYDPMKVDVDCSQIFSPLDSIFTGVDENGQQFNLVLLKESSCSGGTIVFSYAALPSIEDNLFITGEKTVAEIKVTSKQDLGMTSLEFTSFEVFDLDTGMPIAGLTQKNANFEIVSAVLAPTCGDSDKAPTEQCDDGNDMGGDGCSAACLVESGFSCAGEPSVCAVSAPVLESSASTELLPATVYEYEPFSLKIKANTGSTDVQQILFNLPLPEGIDCTGITVEDLLTDWHQNEEARCEAGEIILNSESNEQDESGFIIGKSGLIEIAEINFPGYAAGTLSFIFSEFKAYDENNANQVPEIAGLSVTIKAKICGNSVIDPGEQCDLGGSNGVMGQTCNSNCLTWLSCNVNPNDSDSVIMQNSAGSTTIATFCNPGDTSFVAGFECLSDPVRYASNIILCDSGEMCKQEGTIASCVPITQPQFQCTGTNPDQSQLCSGDDASLSADTAKTAVSQCGMAKCEYQCNTNSAPNAQGTDCVLSTSETALTVTGTKIILTDVATVSNVFSTKITATESFSNEIIIYTVLYGSNNKVLSIKSEKVEAGLADGTTYTAAVNYPAANVKSKSVIVYDVEQNPSVFGQLQKSYQ